MSLNLRNARLVYAAMIELATGAAQRGDEHISESAAAIAQWLLDTYGPDVRRPADQDGR